MNILLQSTPELKLEYLNQLKSILKKAVPSWNFKVSEIPLGFQEDPFDREELFDAVTCQEEFDYTSIITSLNDNLNWFSAFSLDCKRSVYFICTNDWEYYVQSSSFYPVAYEVLANIVQFESFKNFGNAVWNYVHDEPIGCVNDMCGWKADINFKLRTADICNDCLNEFEKFIPNEILCAISDGFEFLRGEMVSKRKLMPVKNSTDSLPANLAITKLKIASTHDRLRKLYLLIDHFDNLIKTAVLLIVCETHSTTAARTEFLEKHSLNTRPSLGNWVQALVACRKLDVTIQAAINEVLATENDNNIVSVRNSDRGHGYLNCTHHAHYENRFEVLLPSVQIVEKALHIIFERYEYYYVQRTDRFIDGTSKIAGLCLRGSSTIYQEVSIISRDMHESNFPFSNCVYAYKKDENKWVLLDPYVKYSKCPECSHDRFLIFDGEYLLDPLIGHRFKV